MSDADRPDGDQQAPIPSPPAPAPAPVTLQPPPRQPATADRNWASDNSAARVTAAASANPAQLSEITGSNSVGAERATSDIAARVESATANGQPRTSGQPRTHNETLKETANQAGPGKRITAQRVAAIQQQLTVADLELMDYLEQAKLLTGAHFRRLVGAVSSTEKRALRKQLQRLSDLRIFGRLERRVGGVRAGSESYVYAFDVVGQRIARPGPRRQWRRPWTPSLRILDHTLDVSGFFVDLIEAERTGQIDELVSFTTEPKCWRDFTGPGGARLTLKPDAHVIVGHGDTEHHAWIEVDRATESLPWIVTKAQAYGHYFDSGREQSETGVFPICWWLAPSQRRADDLALTLACLPPDHCQLHRVATLAQAISALLGDPDTRHPSKSSYLTEGGPRP